MAELKVSLTKPSLSSDGVSVWEWTGSALDEGDEAAKWFTEFLGKPSRLVRFNEGPSKRKDEFGAYILEFYVCVVVMLA
ncbi:amidoxime reducing component, partial [Tanacetum coccineum]